MLRSMGRKACRDIIPAEGKKESESQRAVVRAVWRHRVELRAQKAHVWKGTSELGEGSSVWQANEERTSTGLKEKGA